MMNSFGLFINIKSFCYCLYHEFRREYCYKKEFAINSFFTFVKQSIFLLGIFFSVIINDNNGISVSMVFRIYGWYSLIRTIEYATESLEREVRQQQWNSLSDNRVPFFMIYFCRYIVYNLEAALHFIFCAVILNQFIVFNFDILLGTNTIAFFMVIFVHNIIFYFAAVSFILKYKRIGAVLGIFSFMMLFYSGMVFESNSLFSELFYAKIVTMLYSYHDTFLPQILCLLFAFIGTCFFMKQVYTDNKSSGKLM